MRSRGTKRCGCRVMESIKIWGGGKIKNTPFQKIEETYVQRIHRWPIHVQEIPDKKWEKMSPEKGDFWVALCQHGPMFDSLTFGQCIEKWMMNSKRLCFLIGPSCGLPESILDKSHKVLSLSPMTWPHLMARTMLVEQIYRAQQQARNHSYSFV